MLNREEALTLIKQRLHEQGIKLSWVSSKELNAAVDELVKFSQTHPAEQWLPKPNAS